MKRISNLFKDIKSSINEDLSKIFGEKYLVININSTDNITLNDWNYWKLFYSIFDQILKQTDLEKDTYIRSFQSFKTEKNWLGFGRMKWNLQNNQKWTQKYNSEEYSSKELEFFNTEIWSPNWNNFDKTGNSPKFFSKVYHENINKGIFIAVDLRLYKNNSELIDGYIEEIVELIPNSKLNLFTRFWKPSKGFYNNIIDITYSEIETVLRKNL